MTSAAGQRPRCRLAIGRGREQLQCCSQWPGPRALQLHHPSLQTPRNSGKGEIQLNTIKFILNEEVHFLRGNTYSTFYLILFLSSIILVKRTKAKAKQSILFLVRSDWNESSGRSSLVNWHYNTIKIGIIVHCIHILLFMLWWVSPSEHGLKFFYTSELYHTLVMWLQGV